MDEPTEKQALGRRLAAAREAAGLTGPAVGIALAEQNYPVSKGAVSAWEVGRNDPGAIVLGKLAKIYKTTPDALLGFMHSKTPRTEGDLTGQEGILIALYRLMSPADRQRVLADVQKTVAPPKIELVQKANSKKP